MVLPSAAEDFSWDACLPERAQSSAGTAGSFGWVSIRSAGEERTIRVPRAVARALRRDLDAGTPVCTDVGEVERLVAERSARCASERVAGLLNRRDYSTQELRDRLARDGYDAEVAERAVQRAVKCGLASDARYADVFIRSKVYGGWGRQRIERELRRRGIEPLDVSGWPDEYLSEDDEFERALELARTRRLASTRAYEKLVRYLCGRGYSLGLSCRVARQVTGNAERGA